MTGNPGAADALAANRQLALQFLEHAFANRIDASLALLSDDAIWWAAGNPDRLRVAGLKQRVQIERLLKSVARLVPGGMQMAVRGTTAEGNRVAVEAEAEGPCGDGRIYRNTYHFLFEVRDGLIVAVREYMDTLQVFDILQQ